MCSSGALKFFCLLPNAALDPWASSRLWECFDISTSRGRVLDFTFFFFFSSRVFPLIVIIDSKKQTLGLEATLRWIFYRLVVLFWCAQVLLLHYSTLRSIPWASSRPWVLSALISGFQMSGKYFLISLFEQGLPPPRDYRFKET